MRKRVAKSGPKGKRAASSPEKAKKTHVPQIDEVPRRKMKFLSDASSVAKKTKVHLKPILALREIVLQCK